ncbi:hypothetical protein Ddc_19394 [Ditylenchus destructor]|nr:hypothetical protein Ddc_19394 [Ditylenchus destructor]
MALEDALRVDQAEQFLGAGGVAFARPARDASQRAQQLLLRGDGGFDRGDLAVEQLGQRDDRIRREQRRDFLQRQADLAIGQDAVQPLHVRVAVEPITAVGPGRRQKQAKLFVMMQRAHGQAGALREVADGVGHERPWVMTARIMNPDVTSGSSGGSSPAIARLQHVLPPVESEGRELRVAQDAADGVGGDDLVGVAVGQIVDADAGVPVSGLPARRDVRHPGRAEALVVGRIALAHDEAAVAAERDAAAPCAPAVLGAGHQLVLGRAHRGARQRHAVDQLQLVGGQQRGVVGDAPDRVLDVAEGQRVIPPAPTAPVLAQRADQVHAAGARVQRVGEVATRADQHALRGQLRPQRRRQAQVGGEQHAVVDVDLVSVDRGLPVGGGLQQQTQAQVAGLLRLERLRAQRDGRGRTDREGTGVHQRAVDQVGRGGREELLGQRGRAEAGGQRAAQRDGGGEGVAAGELGRGGVAEVAVALGAQRGGGAEVLGQLRFDAGIDGFVVAAVAAGVGRLEAREAGRAAVLIGAGLARIDAVALTAVLGAQRQRQRREEAGVDLARQVGIEDGLLVGQPAGVEARRAGRAQRVVGGVGDVDVEAVAAVIDADVPAPAGGLAARAEHRADVGAGAVLQRQEALRIERGDAVGRRGGLRAPESGADRIASAEGGDGVDLREIGLAPLRIDDGRLLRAVGIAEAVVDQAAARLGGSVAGVDAGAVGALLMTGLDGQSGPALVAERQTQARRGGAAPAVTGVGLTGFEADVAAGRALAQHDVDDACNGVRAVLRGGAVAKDLDVIDGGERNGVQVHRRGAAALCAVDVDDGGGVTPLAVDQDQGLVGRQTAQLGGRTASEASVSEGRGKFSEGSSWPSALARSAAPVRRRSWPLRTSTGDSESASVRSTRRVPVTTTWPSVLSVAAAPVGVDWAKEAAGSADRVAKAAAAAAEEAKRSMVKAGSERSGGGSRRRTARRELDPSGCRSGRFDPRKRSSEAHAGFFLDADAHSALHQRELHAQSHERGREAAPHPAQHRGALQHAVSQRGGEDAVDREDGEGHRHEDGGEGEHLVGRLGRVGGDELRQKCDEEDRQLGVEQVHQDRVNDDLARRTGWGVGLDGEGAAIAQRGPGHVEQVQHARDLDRVEGGGAGMQQRGQAGDRGQHVRNDAQRAADGRHHRGARALREAGRQRHERARPGRRDDDQRGDQEFRAGDGRHGRASGMAMDTGHRRAGRAGRLG